MGTVIEGYRTAIRKIGRNGEFVTVAIRQSLDHGAIEILDGTKWREARPGEIPPPSKPLPQVSTDWVR